MLAPDFRKKYPPDEWEKPKAKTHKIVSVGDILATHRKAEKAQSEAERLTILKSLDPEEEIGD